MNIKGGSIIVFWLCITLFLVGVFYSTTKNISLHIDFSNPVEIQELAPCAKNYLDGL